MPVLNIDRFSGLLPLYDQRKLPDGGATIASWTRLDGGDLRPFKQTLLIAPDPSSPSNYTLGSTQIYRLYRYTTYDGVSQRWLAWVFRGLRIPSAPYIDVAPSPISRDVLGRLYWTNYSDKAMVASNPTIDVTLGNIPGARVLGIPAPINKPTCTAVNDATATTATIVGITKGSPAVVSLAGPLSQPFTAGQQVLVTIPGATGTNMSELSGKEFLVDIPASDTTHRLIELRGSNTTNYSTFTSSVGATISLVYTDSDYEDRAYVTTLVSDWGEEGPPSPPSDVVRALLVDGTATVTVAQDWNRDDGNDGINRMRIYRTESGTNGAQFYFVGETTVTGGSAGSAATIPVFTDNVKAISLGEELPSTDWTAPVPNMFGLLAMPNGFFIAVFGNTVYACEPYEPHAWPDKYRKTLDYNIIGTAGYAQSAVIATNGSPYLVTGTDPASLTESKINLDAPCISSHSVISVGDGVAYATYEGLAVVSESAAQIITQDLMSKADWLSFWDAGMRAVFHEGTYFAISNTSAKPSFAIRVAANAKQLFKLDGLVATAPAIDTFDDSMYFVTQDNSNVFRNLTQWEGSATEFHNYNWQSKLFTLPKPVNFAVAQVFAASYPVQITISATTDVTTIDSVVPVVTGFSVQNSEPFRLPSGFVAREWQVSLTGSNRVQKVALATSMTELAEQ